MEYAITGAISLTILGITIRLINSAKQEINNDVNRRFSDVMYSDTCNAKSAGLEKNISDLRIHLDMRIDDLKDTVRKNGNGKM